MTFHVRYLLNVQPQLETFLLAPDRNENVEKTNRRMRSKTRETKYLDDIRHPLLAAHSKTLKLQTEYRHFDCLMDSISYFTNILTTESTH